MQLLVFALCLPLLTIAHNVPKREFVPARSHRNLAHSVANLIARDQKRKRCRVKPSPRPSNGTTPGGSEATMYHSPSTIRHQPPITSAPHPSDTPSVSSGKSDFILKNSHEGNTFFDGWDFWSTADPTHGTVEFLNRNDAQANNLISINSEGNAIMRVETTPKVSGNRKSIRLHDQYVFNGGLLIMDSIHMPVGCGVWPAWWSNGPDWPNKGEIDIIEGVNDNDINQSSIHTAPGCQIPEKSFGASGTLVGGANCASAETNNGGCGLKNSATQNNYGIGFNDNGGGVYATLWDDSGITIHFFPRGSIPSDITNEAPTPDKWPMPVAKWPSTNCDPYKFFVDHIAIFDTTLCGDWAGNVWDNPGPTGKSCAALTGYSSCSQYVQEQGEKFKEAYWEVRNVKYYQHK